jgi:hypothetical protein
MRESDCDKFPAITVPGVSRECAVDWDKIAEELQRATAKGRSEKPILVVECYPGIDESAMLSELQSRLKPALAIKAADAYHSPEKIEALVTPYLQFDDIRERFDPDHSRRLSLVNFFDAEPLWRMRRTIDELKGGLVLIVGCGASLIAWGHLLVFAELTRREAQQRFQRNETGNLGADNHSAHISEKHTRAFVVDWRVADRWKHPLIKRWDYVLDANDANRPKLADAEDVRSGLKAATKRPFRVVPFGDSKRESQRSGPFVELDESSLLLVFGELRFEIPAVDLIFNQPRALLGEAVHIKFGYQFPLSRRFLPNRGFSEPVAHGNGWREERAGADERNFVEMRRHWFSKMVTHDNHGSVNVVNLFQGEEAIIESPEKAFEPCVIQLAESLVIPAAVGRYTIRPHGPSVGTEIGTTKACVRFRDTGNRLP